MVDRAANRRKFLIVKRNPMSVGAPVVAGPNGLTTAQPAAAAPPPVAAAAPGAEATAKAGAVLLKDVQAGLSACIEECLAQLEDLQKQVDGAKTTDDPAEVSGLEEMLDALQGVGDACEDAVYAGAQSTGTPAPEDADAENAGAADADGQPAQAPNQPGPPLTMGMGKRLAVAKARRTLAKAEGAEQARSLVTKYGRKLKKERHDRLVRVLGELQSLTSELAPSPRDVDKGAPPPMPPGKGKPKPGEKKPGGAPCPPAPAAKAVEVDAETAKKLSTLETQVASLQADLKKRAEADAAARGTVTKSNAAQPEGSRSEAVDDVSWPLDMNELPDPEGSTTRF